MSNDNNNPTDYTIITYILYILGGIGYIWGIVRLFQCDWEKSFLPETLYTFGIITGLNVLFGWINFGK